MSRLIYLLRHGQTRFNAEQRLQGRCNSDLTDKGEAQAIALGRRLAAELADPARWTVYASPLGRARQTALLVCEQLGLSADRIIWDDRLMELGMGEWESQIPVLRLAHPELDTGKGDWYLQAPGPRASRAFSAGHTSGCRILPSPSGPSLSPTVCSVPCCVASMPISTMGRPGHRSCRKMPSISCRMATSLALPASFVDVAAISAWTM